MGGFIEDAKLIAELTEALEKEQKNREIAHSGRESISVCSCCEADRWREVESLLAKARGET